MKAIKLINWLLPVAFLGLAACGNVRELPTEKIITIYNSNLEQTNKMNMLDTLYVKVGGLKPNAMHTVEALDPDNKLISQMTAMSDSDGVIAPSALWYDVGMRSDTKLPESNAAGLSLKSFYVHVTGPGGTDYKEPFYIVTSSSYPIGTQPKPVVWTASIAGGGMEHSFDETGTTDASGTPGKTKVFVNANNIPSAVNGTPVTTVDIYIVPSKGAGNLWQDGESLTNKFVVRKLNVQVVDDPATNNTTKKLSDTIVWDLDAPQLINPDETHNSYDVIVDVNQNGNFEIGQDIDHNGNIDRYIDGISGQGVVGFTVANTPANEFFVNITDANGNKMDTINQTGSTLFIALNNVPFGSAPVLHLYSHGTTAPDVITAPVLTLMPANLTDPWTDGHYLPYVAATKFIDTILPYSSLTPIGIGTPATSMYDLVVTGIGSTNYAATIKVIHLPAEVIMSDGIAPTTYFDETGTSNGQTKVYVSTSSAGLAGDATIYVMPHRAGGWANGTILSNFTVSKKITSAGWDLPTTLLWDLDAGPKLINPTSANNTYDVIVDANNNGIYETGELINSSTSPNSPAFLVRDTPANDTIDLIYINIASGGNFTPQIWDPVTNSYYSDWDYRDSFASDGHDTNYTWESHGAGYGQGIKAVWNPYIKPPAWAYNTHWGFGGNNLVNSIYQGASVDLYIVDAKKTKGELNKVNLANIKLGQGNFVDVAGGKKTVPVQTSCYNGAGLYNIWQPKFTVGQYYVIVDVNRNGTLDEGVDIIDAVNKNGKSIKDDPNIVGFEVK